MRRRVVITGMGVITATAGSVEAFDRALRDGASGVKEVTLFDATPYAFRSMGQATDLEGEDGTLDRASQLAKYAARAAVRDAGADWVGEHRRRIGVALGTTCGGVTSHEQILRRWASTQPVALEALDEVPFHVMAQHVAREHRLEGPVATITIACASGANAVGYAADLIRSGHADAMLAGGSDTVSHFTFSGFSSLRAMTGDACRPFDEARSGIVLGEGAGVLVLEDEERALRRGARIHAEVLGYGFCNDAYHSTAPAPDGGGMLRSAQDALRAAGLGPDDIDYVNAHGTATQANDAMEIAAYRTLFGERAARVPVSSIKAMVGHTLGAAGAIELVATVLALKGQYVPPTINALRPTAALDTVPERSREERLRHALCCNAGFGGHNTAVVLGRAGPNQAGLPSLPEAA
jgi:3-oxoacyl-[acyl-carrier-protein] synthase II